MARPMAWALMALGISVAVLLPPAAVGANGLGEEVEVMWATLGPCCGDPEPEAHGKAIRKIVTDEGITLRERFRAKVEVPVPSIGLAIADEAAATSADIRVILSREGADYAECLMEFIEVETELEDGVLVTEAKYKVNVVQPAGGPLLLKRGTCDVDLTLAGVQPGVPQVLPGDVATVVLVVDQTDRTLDVPFLDGVFVVKP